MTDYEAVIGLEIHAQLKTESKLFCGCDASYGAEPNANACPVCLGHPGALPVLNERAVEFAALLGMAIESRVNPVSIFARKNYFYPDLPKGYQISQFDKPICTGGRIALTRADGVAREIGVTRAHMEEDAGKSIHDRSDATLVDVNRCGVPLIEIVSEPDLRTAEEARLYVEKIRQIVRYLRICDGNMEEGSLRCDANVSVRPRGETELGVKTEIKNMNSFKSVERAVEFEIERQIDLIEDGGEVTQQTLLWDADRNVAVPMRGKESAHDYRYFPEPDLPPVALSEERLAEIRTRLPELPDAKRERFVSDYGLPDYDAGVLSQSRDVAEYFERVANASGDAKAASNWTMGEVAREIRERKIEIAEFPLSPERLAEIIALVKDNVVSATAAKEVFVAALEEDKSPKTIVEERNLGQISDASELDEMIDQILKEHTAAVEEYLAGKEKAIGFLVGQAMRLSRGKANPQLLNKSLRQKLESMK
jgi:aspartyl-tRNA(Asn)/glutamyl-tRNA(Gln) amidotransferase subunit B